LSATHSNLDTGHRPPAGRGAIGRSKRSGPRLPRAKRPARHTPQRSRRRREAGRSWVRRSPLAIGRDVLDRVFPRGALILSVLSFAYFLMGIVRNRVFANTFGV